ncbi:hypothetical protein R3P38DRAFT_2793800 [Favolaschia claudopus]|uniref:Gag protein n=1 Tax=Favolaschia claudopus TaxID=2862362 RepID=A0AAW0ACF9_9AGAR
MPADRTSKPAASSRADLKKRKDHASDPAARKRAATARIDALEKLIIAGVLRRSTETNNPVTISDHVRDFTTAVARFAIDFDVPYRSKSTESAQAQAHRSNYMSLMGGGRESETLVINPFRLDDPRRLEFDVQLRKLVAEWQDVRMDTLPPFDDHKGIMFKMPNEFWAEWPKTDAGLARWLQISVYEKTLNTLQYDAIVAAKIRVPSVMPPPPSRCAVFWVKLKNIALSTRWSDTIPGLRLGPIHSRACLTQSRLRRAEY